ncbi:related to aspergillopepsin II precursor [Claviceps purpurea 20.1]|uniref:Related to aspergillopepsin II n=1 Tax=Claviceps purpurea (strain 20.1) TaxID=1111077 RepID=M1VWZ1_CLAP2|nr:hypothetical protein E4U50_007240 [Claviceps purpurea]CCE32112.1 related to aspergillopepsin II precursor [Claviceps purpurea 20.1]
MKFLTGLALVASASATSLSGSRMQSRPRVLSSSPAKLFSRAGVEPAYSPNWAGAVQSGTGFHYVEGTITVPKVSGKPDAAAAAWVGIDGVDCQQAILQTGVSFHTDGTFEAWYEWYPEYSHNWDNFKIKAGDQIKMIVDATTSTSGTASLENLTTGQKVSQHFPKAPVKICGVTAEWIVEDFTANDHQVPFANFGSITFTNAIAKGDKGSVSPQGAEIYAIREENAQSALTSCGARRGQVSCHYV